MFLSDFFQNAPNIEIQQLSSDSRIPMKDAIFFCLQGVGYDGHDYIDEAIRNGAKVIVYDKEIETNLAAIYIKVANVVDVLAQVGNAFYGYPGKGTENIIVGGNYNRNIIAYSLYQIINKFRSCGYIGQQGIIYQDTNLLSQVPTLPIINSLRTLKVMKDKGILSFVGECDYNALKYHKLKCLTLNAFLYSGSATDDKEYADAESDYLNTYRSFLQDIDAKCDICLNIDDSNFERLSSVLNHKVITFGFNDNASYRAENVTINKEFTTFDLLAPQGAYHVETLLFGRGGVASTLAIISLLGERGYPLDQVIEHLTTLSLPSGYQERLNLNQNYNIIIDKAPSLSSVKDILEYSKEITDTKHKIIVIEGIGPKLDRRFRNSIAHLLDEYVDEIIVTENNIYDENFYELAKSFVGDIKKAKYILVEERENAIEAGINLMNKDDTLLILGKGEENYLYRSLGKEYYKGDKECVKDCLLANGEVL